MTEQSSTRQRIVEIVGRNERPTIQEIADELKMPRSTVQGYIECLIADGVLARREGRHRDLRLASSAK